MCTRKDGTTYFYKTFLCSVVDDYAYGGELRMIEHEGDDHERGDSANQINHL